MSTETHFTRLIHLMKLESDAEAERLVERAARLSPEEAAYIVDDCDARVFVTSKAMQVK